MPISVSTQAYVFLCSVIGGILIAFVYDLFRIKRKAMKTANLFVYLEDLLYWVVVAVIIFAVVYYSNEGEIRGYVFIGTVLGIILYALLLSKPIMGAALFILHILSVILKFLWKIFSFPFRVLFKLAAIPARSSTRFAGKAVVGVRRIAKNRLSKAALWTRVLRNIRKKI